MVQICCNQFTKGISVTQNLFQMCFHKCNNCISDPSPLYDEQGSLTEDESQIIVPEDIHEHTDNVYLNFGLQEGILGFIYETSYKVFFVWTSPEAENICELYVTYFLQE